MSRQAHQGFRRRGTLSGRYLSQCAEWGGGMDVGRSGLSRREVAGIHFGLKRGAPNGSLGLPFQTLIGGPPAPHFRAG